MKHIHTFQSFVTEGKTIAAKSNSPEQVITIDVDLGYAPAEKKDVMAALKKFNITVKATGANSGMAHDLTGKKKDLIAYLTSEYYEMDDADIKEFYPELLEGVNEGTLEITGHAYDIWNDRQVQRDLKDVKIKIVGDMKGVMTLSGDEKELDKVRAIFGIKESIIDEGQDNKYWADYEKDTSGQGEAWQSKRNEGSAAQALITRCIEYWNENAEDDGMISTADKSKITAMAKSFIAEYKWINGNIIDAMIAQTA
jgi:hypothetical protein